jgi:3-oxoadipate enol-lactonase
MPRLPRIPVVAPVGRPPAGRVVQMPGRGSTYVVDTGGLGVPPACGGERSDSGSDTEPVTGAPTFMLLHSVACTGLMTWYPALEALSELGRVVVFDQRWHGQGISSSRFLLEDCADDVAALADELGIETFVPVGFSMGSLVAQLVWYRHRQRVDGLVLCAATASWSRASYERLGTGLFAALVDAFTRAPGTPAAPTACDDAVRGDHRWLFEQFRSTSPAAIGRAIAEFTRFDSSAWVGDIDVPTAVVITTRDRVLGSRRQQWLADQIPDARTFTVEAGHASCTLQPGEFVPVVSDAVEWMAEALRASRPAIPRGRPESRRPDPTGRGAVRDTR